MRLSELILHERLLGASGNLEREVRRLCYDSRQVMPGDLFFALRGGHADGHAFVPAVLAAGAAAVVVEDDSVVPAGATAVRVADCRRSMARMAASFYRQPSAGMPLVGITGTNGKTTTSYLVEGIFAAAGLPAAVLGTVSYRLGELALPAPHTTPESIDLQRILRELVDQGGRAAVLEVSSHALEQHRVDGCQFDVGVFTNLTPEHLDYHGSMENYLASKQRLFRDLLVPDAAKPQRWAVVNLDDQYGAAVAAAAACRVIGYGFDPEAVVSARQVSYSVDGIDCQLVLRGESVPLRSRLMGRFNLANLLAAAGVGVALGYPAATIVAGLTSHRPVPGRLERVENKQGITVLVDYAHTGDALDNVLRTLAELKQGRIITLFGCGGDRDRSKRPVMGRIAVEGSELTVVTSDNPRSEEPLAIIAEIRAGIAATGVAEVDAATALAGPAGRSFVVEPSRRAAIRLALAAARPGDIVLLAGKGHEDYQIIGSQRLHFDDREEARAALAALGA